MEAKRGKDPVLSGVFSGIQVAYVATDRDLGVLIEIFSGSPKPKTPERGYSLRIPS
jgi:hypothetical protein